MAGSNASDRSPGVRSASMQGVDGIGLVEAAYVGHQHRGRRRLGRRFGGRGGLGASGHHVVDRCCRAPRRCSPAGSVLMTEPSRDVRIEGIRALAGCQVGIEDLVEGIRFIEAGDIGNGHRVAGVGDGVGSEPMDTT